MGLYGRAPGCIQGEELLSRVLTVRELGKSGAQGLGVLPAGLGVN